MAKKSEAAPPTSFQRPYNSVRFICRCGQYRSFPRAPSDGPGGQRMTSSEDLGTCTRVVTETTKEVHCKCGLITWKTRAGFNGSGR
jgi:hypothetical protein